MWPDPADPSRHRFRHMKGTPANKVSLIFALAGSSILLGSFIAFSYTSWFEARLEKYREIGVKQWADRPAKALLQDPLIQQALQRKQGEYELDEKKYKF